MLFRSLGESVINVGSMPVFRYGTGLVSWTKTELDRISTLWIGKFKLA